MEEGNNGGQELRPLEQWRRIDVYLKTVTLTTDMGVTPEEVAKALVAAVQERLQGLIVAGCSIDVILVDRAKEIGA